MDYTQLKQNIKKKNIPPVILLYGTESYFIQNIKDLLIRNILDEEENLSMYDLKETSIQDVIADVETYPFFGDKKLIIASNPIFLQARPEKTLTDGLEHDLTILERYLNDPVEYSILVIVAPYEKIDLRKKISKTLKKQTEFVECNPIRPYEKSKWILDLGKGLNVSIDEDAIELFENHSNDLNQLESELTKMSLFVGENGVITKEIAEQLISQTSNSTSFKLAEAVLTRDLAKALTIYKDLERINEEPIALIALLAYQFRMVLRVKLLKQKGYHQKDIERQIGGNPYPIKIASKRAGRFSEDELKKMMNYLATADATIKQGRMEKGLAFEILLYNLVHK